jgi:hypothetical protein
MRDKEIRVEHAAVEVDAAAGGRRRRRGRRRRPYALIGFPFDVAENAEIPYDFQPGN